MDDEIQEPTEIIVSPAKIEANRRNASKSTGPRTARGKANVRSNALKHGFFAKQVVLSSKLIGEDPKEFQDLLRRLMDHYQPVGAAEELLVEEIAVGFWRERRALRCEMGEIDQARVRHIQLSDPLPGYERILGILKTAEHEMGEVGELSRDTKTALSEWFKWDFLDDVDWQSGGELPLPKLKELGKRQEELLANIRSAIAHAKSYRQQKREQEILKIADQFSIPDSDALSRILRYEALNERRLNRALIQLERLQRRRQGDYVPAPVEVSVKGVQ